MEEDEQATGTACSIHTLTDDALTHVLAQLARGYNEHLAHNPTEAASTFAYLRETLPLVCTRWNKLLSSGHCPLWHTVVVHVSVEVSSHAGALISKRSLDYSATGVAPPLSTSPTLNGSWRPASYMPAGTSPDMPIGSSPRGGMGRAASLSVRILMSERVISWISTRARKCQVLFLDISNPNHDFTARSVQHLLTLMRPTLKRLYLSDGPGQGRQEGYEVLSTLKALQQLHVKGIPQDFLHLTMPYLAMLPSLQLLSFKPDMYSYPSPARLTTLPPGLNHLELVKLWIEHLPKPYNKPMLQPPPPQQQQQLQPLISSHSSNGGRLSTGGASGTTAAVQDRRQASTQDTTGITTLTNFSLRDRFSHSPYPGTAQVNSPLDSTAVPLGTSPPQPRLASPFPSPSRVPPPPAYTLQTVHLSECHITPSVFICLATSPLSELHLHKCTLADDPLRPNIMMDHISIGTISLPRASSLRALTLRACGVTHLSEALLCSLTGLSSLDLSGNEELGLKPNALPLQFASLVHLTRLDLKGCGLVVLPPPVAALPHLVHLNLELNALTGLPKQMACDLSLEVANISCNRLTCLPPCLLAMTSLRRLVVSSGPVAGTHDFITLHNRLPRLTHLQVKGATYDCKAVRNLMILSREVQQSGSRLQIDIIV